MGALLELEIWQLALLGVFGLGALGLAAVNFRFTLWLAGAMLFFAAIGTQLTWNLRLVRTIITGLQGSRSTLYLAVGGLFLLAMIMHVQRVRFRSVSGLSIVLVMTGVYAGLIRTLAVDVADGLASVGFAAVTLIPLALALPSLIRDWWDMYLLPRVVGVVGLGWCGLCVLQFVANRRALTTGYLTQRFVGMTGNPQHAAAFLAFVTICCIFLVLNDPKTRYRVLWIGTAALSSVFLLWTASRTGVAMATIGILFCFYGRAGVGFLLLPIVGGVALIAYQFLTGERVDFDIERLAGGGQTRGGAWAELWGDFVANPLFGNGGTGVKDAFRAEKSENSLLYGLATYGAGMGILILLLALVAGVTCLRLVRLRRVALPYQRRVIEFLLGAQAMFWAGSVFEGYIVGRVSAPIVFMMFFAAMNRRTIELLEDELATGRAAEGFGTPESDQNEELAADGVSDQVPYDDYGPGPSHGTREALA